MDGPTPFAERRRAGFTVTAEVLTWDVAAFRIRSIDGARQVVACLAAPDAPAWLARLDAGDLDAELIARLRRPPRRRLRRMPRSVRRRIDTRPERLGVEHEWTIERDGTPVDFRRLLAALPSDAPTADPIDPNARRYGWGVITADGAEAETAIEAVPVRPGFTTEVLRAAERARRELLDRLPAGLGARGYSTHLSVSWAPTSDRRQALRWGATFGLGLMLLLDDASSPGLLVRPRPGRLEFGGEHASGERLAAAAAYAVGSTRVLAHRGAAARTVDALALRARLDPAVERFGWYLDRRAFGPDLYTQGRGATVTPRRGPQRSAQQHLDAVLPLVLAGLADVAEPEDTEALVDKVAGRRQLPCETTGPLPLEVAL